MKQMRCPIAVARTVLLVVVICVVALACGERGRVAQADLRSEWSQIRIPPGATVTSQRDLPRTTRGLLGASFSSDSSFDEVKRFYEAELASHGWLFRGERVVRKWGRDVGEREFIYCKGTRSALLFYPGLKSGHATTYMLELAWGSNACEGPAQAN